MIQWPKASWNHSLTESARKRESIDSKEVQHPLLIDEKIAFSSVIGKQKQYVAIPTEVDWKLLLKEPNAGASGWLNG